VNKLRVASVCIFGVVKPEGRHDHELRVAKIFFFLPK